jgi:hypothetical protein
VKLTVGGHLLGHKAVVRIKGTHGSARGVKRLARLSGTRTLSGLKPGRYTLRPRTISSGGWVVKAASKRVRIKPGHTRSVSFTYVVVSGPQPQSSTSQAPQTAAVQRKVWRSGWWWLDLNADGRWDTAAQDPQGDGTTTNVWSDVNADGYYDLHWWDATGDGRMDSLQLDPDYNRTMDAYLWDSDGDGRLDSGYSDATGRRTVTLNSQTAVNTVIAHQSVVNLIGLQSHWEEMGFSAIGSVIFPTIPHPALM